MQRDLWQPVRGSLHKWSLAVFNHRLAKHPRQPTQACTAARYPLPASSLTAEPRAAPPYPLPP